MEHGENCIVKKGWFPETADGIDESFCFASLDVDLYQPTLAGLRFFYPRLSPGGYLMIHDFNNREYPGVRQAVREFCTETHAGYVCLPDFCGSAVIAR
ncbi:TylF/MycF/NovP-related O-methyltransferase [Fretibacterium fastidiosum]|nr:TylF/MycF/NovP-related O-methyltransferase [Fretibacterium fastidiosum]